MCNKKKKWKYIAFSSMVGILAFVFLILSGKIQYGNMEDKFEDTEVYGSYANRDFYINQNDSIEQELIKPTGTLKSFSIKYHKELFDKNLLLNIELCDSDTGEVIQKWTENGNEIGEDGLREYILENQKIDSTRNLKLKIKANQENDAIYCSSIDSLHGGVLRINGEEQDGDIILRMTQNLYVVSTVVWGIIISCLIAVFCFIILYYKIWNLIKEKVGILCSRLKTQRKNVLKTGGVLFLILLLSIIIEKAISHYNLLPYNTVGAFNEYRCLFFVSVMICIYSFVKLKAYIIEKPEYVFLVLIAIVGVLYVMIMPAEAEISWDEAIHYWRAVGVSHALSAKTNYADSWIYWHSGIGYRLPNSIENLKIAHNNLQMMYDEGRMITSNTDILEQILAVAYIPSAIGLIIGRALNIPYMLTYHLGAAMNMLLYIILVYFSVKRLKSGKMICITVACVLDSVFLASVYSSDSWITGLCMLGTSYFIGNMQEDGKVCKKDRAIMLISYLLAFMAKAVYFPLFLLFLFLPMEKFENRKQCIFFRITTIALSLTLCLEMVISFKWFLIILIITWLCVYGCYLLLNKLTRIQIISISAVCIIVGIIVGYFGIMYVLPGLLGVGDLRGGSEVNSAGQVVFIMKNPVVYAKILIKFMLNQYLSFQADLQGVFNTFGYMGQSSFATISFVLLWFVVFTDKKKVDIWRGYNKVKAGLMLIDIGIVILIATALYVSFTPVRYESINGCQARYLLPLYAGIFMMIGSNKIENKMSEKLYNSGVIIANILILLLSAWQVVVRLYY